MAQSLRILLVEDNEELAALIALRLKTQRGYEVVHAFDGEEALQQARGDALDLMILDLLLPKLDGFEVLSRLKRDPPSKGIPILVLTALAQEEVEKRALASGAGGFLRKPFQPKELMDAIDRLLQRRQEPTPPTGGTKSGGGAI